MAKDQERGNGTRCHLSAMPASPANSAGEWWLTAFNPGITTLVQDKGENIGEERRHSDEKSTSALVRLLDYSWSETTHVPTSELHEASGTMQPLKIIIFYTAD